MKRTINLFALLILPVLAGAQVMSLDSILAKVDRNNPMLQQYASRAKAYQAYSEGARSWMAPMVGAGTFMTPYPGQGVTEDRDKGNIMISLEQNIPNGARQQANQKYLASRANVEQYNRSFQFNELRTQAKSYYYRWLVAGKQLQILRENEAIMNLLLKLEKIRYPYNQGALGNIYKAEGRLAEVQNMQLMTEGIIDQQRMLLKGLMNLSPQAALEIDTALYRQSTLESLPSDTSEIAGWRSDVKQIDEQISVMRLNQSLQRMQTKPDFRVRFDHMRPIGNMPNAFTAMAMVSIPIAPWSSRMYKAEIKGMEYDIAAMRKEREGLIIESRAMLTSLYAQIKKGNQQLENYQTKIIPALKKNYLTVMNAYEENKEQLPMVIDAWEALNMAQMNYLERLGEYYEMIVMYEKELEK